MRVPQGRGAAMFSGTVVAAFALTERVPATGLHYVAGVAPVGVPAFAAAIALGAWCGRPHTQCSARRSTGLARQDPGRRSIDRGGAV